MGKALLDGWAIDPNGDTALVPDDVLGSGALMNLGGDRDHSGHKGFCLSAMVDILCAVLSGGKWGPTVDGFTTNKLQAMFAGDGDAASNGHADKAQEQDDDEEEESTGIVSPPVPSHACDLPHPHASIAPHPPPPPPPPHTHIARITFS